MLFAYGHYVMPFVPSVRLPVDQRADVPRICRPLRRPRCIVHPTCCASSGGSTSRSGNDVDTDYGNWSGDFLELCRAQLEVLSSSVSELTQSAIFFRRENLGNGALEFVPVAVSGTGPERVWIAGASAAYTELSAGVALLPGGVPASALLPDYPVLARGVLELPDGGLCVPVTYGNVCAGSVVLWRSRRKPWASVDIDRATNVARSIAIAAALDGRVGARARAQDRTRELVKATRSSLKSAAHQMRSPITALVTFGHVLLRKLPVGNELRALAKNIVVEALRLDDLLAPLKSASDNLILAEGLGNDTHVLTRNVGDPHQNDLREQVREVWKKGNVQTGGASAEYATPHMAQNDGSAQLVWMSDVVAPIASSAAVLAEEKGLHFHAEIDDDTPPIRVLGNGIREAIYNLLDNAIHYCPPGAHVGVFSRFADGSVEVLVWDTGAGIADDQVEAIWEHGTRGRAAEESGAPGSGIGLAIARHAVQVAGGSIEVRSPLTAELDPRDSPSAGAIAPGCVFIVRFPRAVL